MGYTPGGAQLPTGAVEVGAVSTITVSPLAPVVMDVQRGTTKSKVCSLGARPRRASTAPKSATEWATRCRHIAIPTTAEPGNSDDCPIWALQSVFGSLTGTRRMSAPTHRLASTGPKFSWHIAHARWKLLSATDRRYTQLPCTFSTAEKLSPCIAWSSAVASNGS